VVSVVCLHEFVKFHCRWKWKKNGEEKDGVEEALVGGVATGRI
jgi:hypothetical protein